MNNTLFTPKCTARMQRLTQADFPALQALTVVALDGVPESFLRRWSESEVIPYLSGNAGHAYALFEGGQMVAAAFMRLPKPWKPNPGSGFPVIPAVDWGMRTAMLEYAMVAPWARRRGLHRALYDARRIEAKLAGMAWLATGAHVKNTASWYNLLCSGMSLVGARVSPQGHEVVALLRPLNGQTIAVHPEDRLRIARDDSVAHFKALQNGYIGIGIEPPGGVVYARGVD